MIYIAFVAGMAFGAAAALGLLAYAVVRSESREYKKP